ncbi:hypothetical protein BWR17_19535 (plasmid) [Phaeobacter inhibens]|nr:hypothetical protein BWR17_19535 [Phaeobacter inhibens]
MAVAAETIQTGYKNAEALALDATTGDLYISVVGEFGGKDGDGFIARMPNGATEPEVFVDNLNGPKGSEIRDGKLYVVEVGEVLVIDLKTKETRSIALPDGGFPLDLTVSAKGVIYVTDPPLNTVYQIADGAVSVLIEDASLGAPNGIYAMPIGDIMVAGWGVISDPNTWETSELGRITRIRPNGSISEQTKPLANFDGLVRRQDDRGVNYVGTGYNDGILYTADAHLGHYGVSASFGDGISDIAYSGGTAFLLNYKTGALHSVPVGQFESPLSLTAR